MLGSLGALPTDDEQTWLLDRLGDLVERVGPQSLLTGALVEPTSAYFPERWTPDIDGAYAITQRLMDFAGLGELKVALGSFEAGTRFDDGSDEAKTAAGLFMGIEDGVCFFGLNVDQMGDPESLAGTMAHEVAHAYRRHRGLVVDDRDLEERLTDLTTVYLGFGILTANAAYRLTVERNDRFEWASRQSGGYLSAEELTFLLAAQVVARCDDPASLRRVDRLLERGQAYCFRRAIELLEDDPDDLRDALAIPTGARRVEPTPPVLAPRFDDDIAPNAASWGRVSHRYRADRVERVTLACATTSMLVGAWAGARLGISQPILAAAIAVGTGLAAYASWTLRRDACAQCKARLSPIAHECPGCFGVVAGCIDEPLIKLGEGNARGTRTYRVRRTRMLEHLARTLLWWFLTSVFVGHFLDAAPAVWTAAGVAVAVGRAAIAQRTLRYHCASPECGSPLGVFMTTCPRCLADVAGEVQYEGQRLDAEELLEDAEEIGAHHDESERTLLDPSHELTADDRAGARRDER